MLSIFFTCLLATYMFSLKKCLFRSSAHFSFGFFGVFCCWVVWVVCISWRLSPCQLNHLKLFPPIPYIVFRFFVSFFVFCLFRAAPKAYGSSQARGRIGATAAGLHHSSRQRQIRAASAIHTTAHGNTGSLSHWVRPGIEPTISWFLVGFVSSEPRWKFQNGVDFKRLTREFPSWLRGNESDSHPWGHRVEPQTRSVG